MTCEADETHKASDNDSEEWTSFATKFDWARMHGEKALFTLRVDRLVD